MPHDRRQSALRLAAVAALLVAGLIAQLRFLESYPQPQLFGDPAGYYRVGERFQEASARLLAGEQPLAVFESIRGLLYLSGVGLLFATLDAVRPGDFAFFRLVFALFNTAGMLGVFFLAKGLSRSFWGGLIGLAIAVAHPSYYVQTGRLYPDPVTGCLLVWAVVVYLTATRRASAWLMGLSGLVFTTALLVRSQLMEYMLVVLGLSLLGSAPAWARVRNARRLVAALILGCLPAIALWAGVRAAAGERDDVIQLGNLSFRPAYPYGFWQFLETDGWIGPYRLRTEPYYKAMEAAAADDPELLRSSPRQLAFTLGYVAQRPVTSVLMVLDNVLRLYDRPANDYKWDYPFAYRWQVVLQRGIVLLALAGMAVFTAERRAVAGVFLVPVALGVLHGLTFPWPRYNQPAMPILMAVAGAFVAWLASRAPRQARFWRTPVVVLGVGGVLLLTAWAFSDSRPEWGRVAKELGRVSLLSLPFLLAARVAPRERARGVMVAVAFACLAVLFAAHALRSRLWHEVTLRLGGEVTGVEQEIFLTPGALGQLRSASEAFVMIDLLVPRGEPRGIAVEIGERRYPGSELIHTMPRLREATAAGGRDRRGYPQWWALRLDPELLPRHAAEPLRVRVLSSPEANATLKGDRFSDQRSFYEGPSFGDWPRAVALKVEYDADYRIPVRLPLGSHSTRSYVLGRGRTRVTAASVHRIRVITLGQNEGAMLWESAPTPSQSRVCIGFAAYNGERGEAELQVWGRTRLRFPLGRLRDFEVNAPPYRLCYAAEGERGEKAYGSFFLESPNASAGEALPLAVRFRSGMSLRPRFFVLDKQRPGSLLAETACCRELERPIVEGAGRIVDDTLNNYPEDVGRWSVAAVF